MHTRKKKNQCQMSVLGTTMFDCRQSGGVALSYYDSKMMQREGGLMTELAQ